MDKLKTYHFTGIKGSGMSALALVLHGKGYKVQGSDEEQYYFTQKGLDDEGITILPFAADNIQAEYVVVAGNAFSDEHEELVRARELGAQVIRYHNLLGMLIKQYTSVAVTGSHGKTTTTGLLAHVLKALSPTSYLIGDGTGRGLENANYFALEACEYRRHFLAYYPDYIIMTNIDFDHPDFYHTLEDVYTSFAEFATHANKQIIACGDDDNLRRLNYLDNIFYYGINDTNDCIAKNIVRGTNGSQFDVYIGDKLYGKFEIPTYGMHNVLNALGVISLCYLEGFQANQVSDTMRTFAGVKRRFSERKVGDMVVIDDYAHHPSEIQATLDAARQKYPSKEIIAVFQPHTFTRTVALLEDFASVLSTADKVYLCDIFASARETTGDITIHDLADKITKRVTVIHNNNLTELLNYKDAIIIFMGAGDIDKLANEYTRLLSQLQPNKS